MTSPHPPSSASPGAQPPVDPPVRVLVAGVGNVFLGDDGFGVEVVRRLEERSLPEHVELVDVGLRARDLAYRLLDGYHALVLVDACRRGAAPGELHVLEHDLAQVTPEHAQPLGHETDANTVLAMLVGLAASMGVDGPVRRVIVVGCEPATVDETFGLSPPVAAALDRAADTVVQIVTTVLDPAHDPSLLTSPEGAV